MMKSSWLVAPFDIFAFRQVGVWVEMETLVQKILFAVLQFFRESFSGFPALVLTSLKKEEIQTEWCVQFLLFWTILSSDSLLIKLFLDSYFAGKNKFIF